MKNDIELQDISNELLILNKTTIDKLFSMENCDDCVVLYIFYYKTAKWQQTNIIKATDVYVKKCLKWGNDKLIKTKMLLRENGLIDIVQARQNDKISGWYIKVSYIVTKKEKDEIKVLIDNSKNSQNQELSKPITRFQETNALKEYNKCLNNNNEILKEKESKKEKENDIYEEYFETFWKEYPKKVAKVNVKKWFLKNKPNEELFNKIMSGLRKFKNCEDWSKDNGQFIPYPSTWLNQERWEDEIQEQERIGYAIEGGWSL